MSLFEPFMTNLGIKRRTLVASDHLSYFTDLNRAKLKMPALTALLGDEGLMKNGAQQLALSVRNVWFPITCCVISFLFSLVSFQVLVIVVFILLALFIGLSV